MTHVFKIVFFLATAFITNNAICQSKHLWTESDRKYLIENLGENET